MVIYIKDIYIIYLKNIHLTLKYLWINLKETRQLKDIVLDCMRKLCKISYWKTMWINANINDLLAEYSEQSVSTELGLHLSKYATHTMGADQPFKNILCLFTVF